MMQHRGDYNYDPKQRLILTIAVLSVIFITILVLIYLVRTSS